MEQLFSQIRSYMDYLSRQGISVTLHFKGNTIQIFPEPVFSELLEVNTHTNPYCIAIKGTAQRKCLLCQKLVLGKCRGTEMFSGSCHAGVREYIHRICLDGQAVGYVAASGYQGDATKTERRELWETALHQEAPEELLQVLLPPLARMVERLLQMPTPADNSEFNLIRQYVNDHYRDLSLDAVCKAFSRSRSYISRLFNENSKMTLRHYCNLRKLEDARQLLLHTDMSVTQIAYEAGFCDTSYFISLFRKHYGVTPYKIRKQ